MTAAILPLLISTLSGPPAFLEDQFHLPPGFRIYKAAGKDLTGGSYDIAFDAQGRLLVGDGKNIRRLSDRDGDGVFDDSEVIAGGLGGRGPQGLQVYGDRVYAVGGDGIQLFTGYLSGKRLKHVKRIGERFNTGGDHAAHTIFRGHDGYLYFITGDGGGTKDRQHITEESSPARFERACSVFRISPDGEEWECVGSGGRNSPNLGMNYLGELFSFDSDMEWHVDLPWWRPVRIHHWLSGGDQGWQGVGAYPAYFLDNLPGILDVGRGSPDWGIFYEHRQFPERYRDSYLVCDYLWKSATSGGYNTVGQLYAFHLERVGAGWKARKEIFARPTEGAKDETGRRINFALVDIDVAPDGSVFLSDHNQGVWRLFHDPEKKRTTGAELSWNIAPLPETTNPKELLDALLALDQPGAEWSRVLQEKIEKQLGGRYAPSLRKVALDPARPARTRLRALRFLSRDFESLPGEFLTRLAKDGEAEIRGQAAWLLGLRKRKEEAAWIVENLLTDTDPFVRRRALEALCRNHPQARFCGAIIEHGLSDPERLIRYAAMIALTHHPVESWYSQAVVHADPQVRMRALMATALRREPVSRDLVRGTVRSLLESVTTDSSKENRLDLLRVLGRFRDSLDKTDVRRIAERVVGGFPDADPDIRREQARLIGRYGFGAGAARLADALHGETNPVEQFHLAQSLAQISTGWSDDAEKLALDWFLDAQKGWFSEFDGKGRQFPGFWATVLSNFASRHREALMRRLPQIDVSSQLGDITLDLMAGTADSGPKLISLYRSDERKEVRRRIIAALRSVRDEKVAQFLRDRYLVEPDSNLRGEFLRSLARQEYVAASRASLMEGLRHPRTEVVRACSTALLASDHDSPDRTLCRELISTMIRGRDVFRAAENLLARHSSEERPGFRADADIRKRPDAKEQKVALAFWRGWYEGTFAEKFAAVDDSETIERSNEEIRRFLLSDELGGGDPARGRQVYEATRCAQCHGFPNAKAKEGQGLVFGPDLAGVTQRLKREELADAMVYPSKLVAERFQGKVVQAKGGLPLTGFITEETDDSVTLVSQEKVHRIPRSEILFIAPQKTSLMPQLLLNRLKQDEIRDLFAYLESPVARSR